MLLACTLMPLMAFAQAKDPCDGQDPDLCTSFPFVSSTAIDNLRRCVDVSHEDASNLSRIKKYSYDFPLGRRRNNLTQEKVSVVRSIEIEALDFGLSSFVRAVEALRWGNCEVDIKISNVSAHVDSNNHIIVGYHFHGDYRECGSFLGIEYKDDAGSNWADVSLKYEIDSNFKLKQIEQHIYNQGEDRNPFHQALGFILPSMGPVGAVLAATIGIELSRNSASAPDPGALAALGQNEFLAISSGITAADRFADQLGELRAPVYTYTKIPERTGLVSIQWDKSEFRYTEKTEVLADLILDYRDVKSGEITYIKDLKFPKPRMHLVRRGDNLWNIADKYYKVPKLFSLIEKKNSIKLGKLNINGKIEVPLLSELCEIGNDGKLVRPGDNIWSLRKKNIGFKPKSSDFRSRRLDLIYPYEEIVLN